MQGRHQRPIGPVLGALWVTHGWKPSQWSSCPICGTVVPVARAAPPGSHYSCRDQGDFPREQLLCPIRTVQCAVLDGLAEMARLDAFRCIKTGARAAKLQ